MKKKLALLPIMGLALISLGSCSFFNNTSKTVASSTDNATTGASTTTASTATGTTTSTSTSTSTRTTTQRTSTSYSSIPGENHGITISEAVGYGEGAYVKFNADSSSYKASYKKTGDTSYTQINDNLVRVNGDSGRVDVLGLTPGQYSIKIEKTNDSSVYSISDAFIVYEQDRSGYAHYDYTDGVGAYNDDGTLKDNAVVVYVNDSNKNTVSAKIGSSSYTGLSNILQHATNANYPVNIRIIGKISSATWKSVTNANYKTQADNGTKPYNTVKGLNGQYLNPDKGTYDESAITSGGYNELDTSVYSKLNGLTNKIKYDSDKCEFDSYYNMLDIQGAKNVTVEGVGEDAEIFQWGFTWKSNCQSIEIKNITFSDYTEDACSFEGPTDYNSVSDFQAKRYWIHNNTFNKGKNYFDVCSEQDKHDGDGATDIKRCAYVTLSYNQYNSNHKTGLVGGGDSNKTASVTFHHNYYNQCQSRLPFARQANMHMYNNYYYKSTGNNMQIYAGAYAFIENCYFDNINTTFLVDQRDSSYGVPAIKSYNNIYNNCKNYSKATIVTSRTQTVSNGNVFGSTFDTDPSKFYYDSTTKQSIVSIMDDTADIPTVVPQVAGAGKLKGYIIDYASTPAQSTIENATYTSLIPTEAGIYGKTTTKDSSEQEYALNDYTNSSFVEVNSSTNRISINDSSDSHTTYAYYIFDNSYTTGTHTYTVKLTTTGIGSKWSIIKFMDGTNTIDIRCSAKTNNKNYWSYSINNGTESLSTLEFKSNTEYTITLTVNYSTSTTSVNVNGTTMNISGWTPAAIKGIQFMTAYTATDRSFTVTEVTCQ